MYGLACVNVRVCVFNLNSMVKTRKRWITIFLCWQEVTSRDVINSAVQSVVVLRLQYVLTVL